MIDRLKVELHLAGVQDARDLESTFAALVAERVEAIEMFDGMFVAPTPALLARADHVIE